MKSVEEIIQELPKRKNKVKPSKRQLATFDELSHAKSLRQAMMKGGYSAISASHPKQNLVESEGFRVLLEQHRDDLRLAGISTKLLAELQAIGLMNDDPDVRLRYIKETKKDLGIYQPDNQGSQIIIGVGMSKKDYED